jgi:hypothetical protein
MVLRISPAIIGRGMFDGTRLALLSWKMGMMHEMPRTLPH